MPPKIIEHIEFLNEQAWKNKRSDTRGALELTTQAGHLAQAHSYERGMAYSLRNSSYCHYQLGDYKNGLMDALQASTLFERLEDKHGLASTLNGLSVIYHSLGEYSKSIEFCCRSLQICEETSDRLETARALHNMGQTYICLSDYARALEYLLQSLKIKKEINSLESLPRTLSNIGVVHEQLGEYRKAADYYLKALEKGREIGDTETESSCLASLGLVYRLMGDYPTALENLLKAADASRKNVNKYPEGCAFIFLGSLYHTMGDPEKALHAFRKGLEIVQQIGRREMEGEAFIGLGELFREQKEYLQAVESLSEALRIAEEIGNREQIFRVHHSLSEIFERQGDYALALSHHRAFYEVRQKVFSEEANENLKRVMIQAEVEKSQKEAEIYRLKHVELAARVRELEDTARELQEVNRRQVAFVSGISHGLKTPLTLIRLYGETLLYGKGFSEEVRDDYYQIITRESERLTHLVNNVLDFSRINRGLKEYAFQEGDIASAVGETVAISEQHLRRAGFTVHVDIASDLPPVQFDTMALSEVILNLLDNASKYCGDQKQIWVSLRSDISKVVLEVEDHGVGIPGSEHERIFEEFYRSRNSTGKGGYGLGLFLVKHAMDAHGGTIEVKSQVGHGSLFRLGFPLSPNRLERGTVSAL